MQRLHHTDAEELDLSRTYNQTFFKKPLGLWYDVNGSWLEWCEGEEYGNGYKNSFLLTVDTSKMLLINSAEKMAEFHAEFNYTPDDLKHLSGDVKQIDWDRLSKLYSGIEISPYRYDFRFGYFWYYCWDVASGCLWDLSIIKSVNKIEKSKISLQTNQ